MVILLACAPPDVPAPAADPVPLLTRASLDLRGVRPSPDEIAAVEADPGALDPLLDAFLLDPRFEGRVRDLWSELTLTRVDVFPVSARDYGLDDTRALRDALGDAPLRVIGHLAAEDRPWTELVTAEWTLADETLATIWPVEWTDGDTGWHEVRWTDGRPAAGVLVNSALWLRYGSTESNANRKRANTAARLLLCSDFLERDVAFEPNLDLLDAEAVADALTEDAGCVGCHATLDPLASYFFGFWYYDSNSAWETTGYYPEREPLWRQHTRVAPAFFGVPGASLADLGAQVAGDPRFVSCAVEQAWRLLVRAPPEATSLLPHREAFLEGGVRMRALVRSILDDPAYAAGTRMVTPLLLGRQVEELTGLAFARDGYDLLAVDAVGGDAKEQVSADAVGFRSLAGGADGAAITATATSPSPTFLLVQERVAEAAAWHAVFEEPARLLPDLDFTETPDTDRTAMAAALQGLHLRLYGRRVAADNVEVEEALGLWASLYAVDGDARAAWAGVLSALLRDPDLIFY